MDWVQVLLMSLIPILMFIVMVVVTSCDRRKYKLEREKIELERKFERLEYEMESINRRVIRLERK